MFSTISEWSYQMMSPFMEIANSTKSMPIIFALLLGMVATLAPCQLTGNISAMMIYGNRSLQIGVSWKHILLFILGKIVAFTSLGLIVWVLGKEAQQTLTLYFPWLRKMMGPLLILIGLVLMGVITIKGSIFNFSTKLINKQRAFSSFFMGFFFSLAFCPTMFIIFFGTLMPLSFSSEAGYSLPIFFALGTAIPVIVLVSIISYLGLNGTVMKKSRKAGKRIQIIAGAFMVIIGIYDSVLYWA
ncbi:sulfite exporter TauE/SafE family protein [Bacillus manliponensis]|uniref:urease accessory protein UreH domain-containing protein n=1 Tax=Bacillus manliponensis TaxID=574376 RepID=UPI003517FC7A